MRDPKSILITGASSGIGAALAREYAGPGCTLFLGGRNQSRLDELTADCTARGAAVESAAIDVTDAGAIAEWIATSDDRAPLDLVIANAGISAGTGTAGEPRDQAQRIMAINVDGVINTVHPALERFAARPAPVTDPGVKGQIAVMSSLASFRGFAGAPAYCASKAAVRNYGEGLRNAYARGGINVSVICPGFVQSGMTDANDFAMPFLMDGDRAARIIRRGLARNRGRIAFPWQMYGAAWLVQALPTWSTDWAMRSLPNKASD
ncbi:MAG: SDR family NAD(P)-dependent oxidoreductase [Alphaproteobacteria bacterium]|nr:SDR family NAD(P)-dependent oxidoreductase [Alphaproteobacteria bacterium]